MIQYLSDHGVTQKVIGDHFGISERQVRNYLGKGVRNYGETASN